MRRGLEHRLAGTLLRRVGAGDDELSTARSALEGNCGRSIRDRHHEVGNRIGQELRLAWLLETAQSLGFRRLELQVEAHADHDGLMLLAEQ